MRLLLFMAAEVLSGGALLTRPTIVDFVGWRFAYPTYNRGFYRVTLRLPDLQINVGPASSAPPGIPAQGTGLRKLWRLPLFHFNQYQQRGISAVLFRRLMKGHNVWMLRQP